MYPINEETIPMAAAWTVENVSPINYAPIIMKIEFKSIKAAGDTSFENSTMPEVI